VDSNSRVTAAPVGRRAQHWQSWSARPPTGSGRRFFRGRAEAAATSVPTARCFRPRLLPGHDRRRAVESAHDSVVRCATAIVYTWSGPSFQASMPGRSQTASRTGSSGRSATSGDRLAPTWRRSSSRAAARRSPASRDGRRGERLVAAACGPLRRPGVGSRARFGACTLVSTGRPACMSRQSLRDLLSPRLGRTRTPRPDRATSLNDRATGLKVPARRPGSLVGVGEEGRRRAPHRFDAVDSLHCLRPECLRRGRDEDLCCGNRRDRTVERANGRNENLEPDLRG
jgi:hypothetical protein